MIATWIRRHGLANLWAPFEHTVTAWIASAAPPWATSEHRDLACMDLGACFFALDDSPPDQVAARYGALEGALAGHEPSSLLQRAYIDLFTRLRVSSHYIALRHQFIDALRVRSSGVVLDASAYLALREITIYFQPWLSTWELLGDFVLSPAERELVAPVLGPANRWQVLENERVSVERDARTGTRNVIALVASEQRMSLHDAAIQVRARADYELALYHHALATLRSGPLAPKVVRYLDTLEHGVTGAMRHHVSADPERYQAVI